MLYCPELWDVNCIFDPVARRVLLFVVKAPGDHRNEIHGYLVCIDSLLEVIDIFLFAVVYQTALCLFIKTKVK